VVVVTTHMKIANGTNYMTSMPSMPSMPSMNGLCIPTTVLGVSS